MAGETEADILGQALKGTEQEIFSEAFGDDPVETEETPDTSLEQMADLPSDITGKAEGNDADDTGETSEGDADGKEAGEDQPADKPLRDEKGKFAADEKSKVSEAEKPRKGDPGVPLKAERERARALEADLDKERTERAADRERFAKLEGTLEAMQRQLQRPVAEEKPKTEADVEPDIFTDPDGWKKWNAEQSEKRISAVQRGVDERFINASMEDAADKHGDTFQAAYKALTSLDPNNPAHRAIVANIRQAPNPGARLMKWHRQQEALREVGDDPNAYKERVKSELLKDPEIRKQILAEMRADAGGERGNDNGGRPRTIIRNPKSLNSEGGRSERASDVAESDGSEDAIFKSAFA